MLTFKDKMPDRIAQLPIDDRGYPIPFFVSYIDGKPEFRLMDPEKWVMCIKEKLCWVCGQRLGAHLAFVVGPMCGINRTTTEPPTHVECATWSAKNCPFLSNPNLERNEHGLDEKTKNNTAGIMIKRNPGVSLIWITKKFKIFKDPQGRPLIRIGDPVRIEFWTKGRLSTRQEIDESIESGCPIIEKIAREDGEAALKMFHRMKQTFIDIVDRTPMAGGQ